MPEPTSWQPLADTLGFANEAEMLKNLYVMQDFSLSQMERILGFSTFSIRRRLIIHGIPLKSRGGANSRLGHRRLKFVTDKDLQEKSAAEIAKLHNVHITTVWQEIRYRAQERAKEIVLDEILSNHADLSLREVLELQRSSYGAGAVHEGEEVRGVLPPEGSEGRDGNS